MPDSSQKVFENFLEMTENGPLAEKRPDRKNKRTRQKNERGNRKRESNDGRNISFSFFF